MFKPSKWTPAMLDFIKEQAEAGVMPVALAPILNERFGTNFSKKAVTSKTQRLGISYKKRIAWTPEAEDILSTRWGLEDAYTIQRRLATECGLHITVWAVWGKAARMGLDYRDTHGHLTCAAAAREAGVDDSVVRDFLARNPRFKAKGCRGILITIEGFEALKEARRFRHSLPETVISVDEAAAGLHVSLNYVRQLCRQGRLRAYKDGKVWLVSLEDADRLRRVLGIARPIAQVFGRRQEGKAS